MKLDLKLLFRFYFTFISFTLLFNSNTLSAQLSIQELDQLKQQLSNEKEKKKQIDLINKISYNFYRLNEDSTRKYTELAIKKAKAINYEIGLAHAYKNLAIVLAGDESTFDLTFEYLSKAKLLARKNDDRELETIVNNNTGLIHFRDRNFDSALLYLTDGRALAEQYLPKENRINTLLSGNLGQCYNYLYDYEKAYKYLDLTLKNAEEYNQEELKSVFLPDYIYSKYKTGRLSDPFSAYEEAFDFHEKRNDFKSKILSSTYLTQIFIEKNKFEEAIQTAKEAYLLSKDITYYYKAEIGNLLATAYYKKNDLENAKIYAEEIYLSLKDRPVSGHLIDALNTLFMIEEKKGNYKEASYLKTSYIKLSQDLIKNANQRVITDLEYRYEALMQEKEILLLQKNKKQQSNLIIFLGILGLVLIAFSTWAYNLLNQKKKNALLLTKKNEDLKMAEIMVQEKNSELQKYIESNIQLENFAYIASHDLKQPLRTILNFLDLFETHKKHILDTESFTFLNFIKDASKRLDKLISDLLAYSIIGTSGEVEKVNTTNLLKEIEESLKTQIVESQTEIILSPQLPTIDGYKSELSSLFQNLISNSIKYSDSSRPPVISIESEENIENWLFKIKDNGRGFSQESLNKIFTIFQRLENAKDVEGTGIGLAHCKKIVELHNGKIWAESKIGKGSTFFFTLEKQAA